MRGEYTITTELSYDPPERWIAVKNVKTYTEDGTEVNREVILTGEMAIGYKAHELLKKYAAFKEQQRRDALEIEEKQKQAAIAVAKRLLGDEVPALSLRDSAESAHRSSTGVKY